MLAERAAILSPALLLPHDPEKNPEGFMRRVAGRDALADVNLGNEGIWTCVLADGGTIIEKIHRRDDVDRSYEYEIVQSPFPLTSYHASMQVRPSDRGATVVWTVDLEPAEMAGELTGPGVEQLLEFSVPVRDQEGVGVG